MVTLTLNNLTKTDVAFQFGQGANPSVEAVVPVGGNYAFDVEMNIGTCTIQAITTGDFGLILAYDFNVIIGSQDLSETFEYGGDYFFLNLRNSSSYTINDLYVNYNLTTEYHLELDMPNNSTWYEIGYFNAWTNSNVYIYYDASDVYWYNDPITLSFENNQIYDLDFDVSNSLSSIVGGNDARAENGILPTRVFEKTDEKVDFSIFD